ncbi:hypothetical protein UlMin_040540 [Ulmus minor]
MVFAGEREEVVKSSMAAGSRKEKPLHNFELPFLTWGKRKHLQFLKRNSDGQPIDRRSFALEGSLNGRGRKFESERRGIRFSEPRIENDDREEGIAAVGEKLLEAFKTETNEKYEIFRKRVAETEADEESPPAASASGGESPPAAADEVKPWNLRKRRAACKAPGDEDRKPNYSSARCEGNNGVKSSRLTRGSPEMKEQSKFALSLTKQEISNDWFEISGRRPARRPKKRPRNVQNRLDNLFPGMSLLEFGVTAEKYRILQTPETGKR